MAKLDPKAVNIWTARAIPFVLIGIVGYATYVLVVRLCGTNHDPSCLDGILSFLLTLCRSRLPPSRLQPVARYRNRPLNRLLPPLPPYGHGLFPDPPDRDIRSGLCSPRARRSSYRFKTHTESGRTERQI
jgi:hypothetical protein